MMHTTPVWSYRAPQGPALRAGNKQSFAFVLRQSIAVRKSLLSHADLTFVEALHL